MPIPSGSVGANFGAGTASMEVKDLELKDHHDFVNSLSGPSLDATVTCRVDWSPPKSRQKLRDTVNQFVIDLVQTSGTITWVASSGGDTFKPVGVNAPIFAGVGHERNGAFFS